MITIIVDEMAEILDIDKNVLKHVYIRNYTLTRYVRTIKDRKGHCTVGFILTPDSINTLMQYLLKKKRSIDGIEELKEFYENMVRVENDESIG